MLFNGYNKVLIIGLTEPILDYELSNFTVYVRNIETTELVPKILQVKLRCQQEHFKHKVMYQDLEVEGQS